jgi:hypothetical protein
MTPTSLIIVADRGSLKAYKVDDTPNRGASLQLVQAFEITGAHGRYDDKLTDQAGRFAVSDGTGATPVRSPSTARSRPKTTAAFAGNWPSTSPRS